MYNYYKTLLGWQVSRLLYSCSLIFIYLVLHPTCIMNPCCVIDVEEEDDVNLKLHLVWSVLAKKKKLFLFFYITLICIIYLDLQVLSLRLKVSLDRP